MTVHQPRGIRVSVSCESSKNCCFCRISLLTDWHYSDLIWALNVSFYQPIDCCSEVLSGSKDRHQENIIGPMYGELVVRNRHIIFNENIPHNMVCVLCASLRKRDSMKVYLRSPPSEVIHHSSLLYIVHNRKQWSSGLTSHCLEVRNWLPVPKVQNEKTVLRKQEKVASTNTIRNVKYTTFFHFAHNLGFAQDSLVRYVCIKIR